MRKETMNYPFERKIVFEIMQGLGRKKKLLHIITGPRQVGKTTASQQIAEKWAGEVLSFSADSPIPPGPEWIQGNWDRAVRLAKSVKGKDDVLLILDEIQKVRGWSEIVKLLWDEELKSNVGLQVLLLGSSSLLLQQGLTESLTGRFFLYRCPHWQYLEMKEAFGWNLEQWIFYGGYPGAADLIDEEEAWSSYVTDSLIETVLAKDILQLQTVAKPALLRHLFLLSCTTPAQILSYNKMLGQLHDAGNTTTLAHYLKLLESAFLVSGLELFKRGKQKKRGSSPKLILWNNALINAVTGDSLSESIDNLSWWGRLVENAVGAHILNSLAGRPYSMYYWRERHLEVDFVLETPKQTWAIEVKSGKSSTMKGMTKFCELYPEVHPLVIGPSGMELEGFFSSRPVTDW
jgi:predicted AAA+ superfamily ATPase